MRAHTLYYLLPINLHCFLSKQNLLFHSSIQLVHGWRAQLGAQPAGPGQRVLHKRGLLGNSGTRVKKMELSIMEHWAILGKIKATVSGALTVYVQYFIYIILYNFYNDHAR